jgi:negative regulator of sigma E activity
MKKIKQDDVCNIPFPIIDVNEKFQYVVYLDSIQSSLEPLKQLLDQDTKLLDQMELSILERAFRGEL